jgi:hypothetical protein
MRITGRIRKTIVFLGQMDRLRFEPSGTAFIAISPTDESVDEGWQTLVTCRHVIDSMASDIVVLRLNDKAGEARYIDIKKSDWRSPNKTIDVAVCPVFLPRDQFDILHVSMDKNVLSHADLREDGVNVGDEVFFSGLFTLRMGERANVPILRFGTIAALIEEKIKTAYGYHDAFLIEARSIAGLSGSPVYVYVPEDKRLSLGIKDEPHLFMGMVLGYQSSMNPNDIIEIEDDRANKERPPKAMFGYMPLNTGIAMVLPSWHIQEAINQPWIVEKRTAPLKPVQRFRAGFVSTSTSS